MAAFEKKMTPLWIQITLVLLLLVAFVTVIALGETMNDNRCAKNTANAHILFDNYTESQAEWRSNDVAINTRLAQGTMITAAGHDLLERQFKLTKDIEYYRVHYNDAVKKIDDDCLKKQHLPLVIY